MQQFVVLGSDGEVVNAFDTEAEAREEFPTDHFTIEEVVMVTAIIEVKMYVKPENRDSIEDIATDACIDMATHFENAEVGMSGFFNPSLILAKPTAEYDG